MAARGQNPQTVANQLIAKVSKTKATEWSKGITSDWALESFRVAKTTAYGKLPHPNAKGTYQLNATYVKSADKAVATQLSKAGVRLATILNKAFTPANADRNPE